MHWIPRVLFLFLVFVSVAAGVRNDLVKEDQLPFWLRRLYGFIHTLCIVCVLLHLFKATFFYVWMYRLQTVQNRLCHCMNVKSVFKQSAFIKLFSCFIFFICFLPSDYFCTLEFFFCRSYIKTFSSCRRWVLLLVDFVTFQNIAHYLLIFSL